MPTHEERQRMIRELFPNVRVHVPHYAHAGTSFNSYAPRVADSNMPDNTLFTPAVRQHYGVEGRRHFRASTGPGQDNQ